MDKRKLLPITLVLIGLLSACSQAFPAQPTQDLSPEYTRAAATIVAALTETTIAGGQVQPTAQDTPPPVQATSTSQPLVTDTLAPTATQMPEPTQTTGPTATTQSSATLTPTRHPGIVFEEDFSGQFGWYEDETDDWTFEFIEGAYRITNEIPGAVLWSIREVEYSDVRLEVDAARTDGPENGYYGVTCRYVDGDNYYGLAVASNGFYAIVRRLNGETQLRETGTAPTGVVNSGNAVNHVRADCIGSTLTLYVNGTQVAQETDTNFTEGYVGLIVGNRLEPGTQATFDNFKIIRP